jgi:hypothetical protein
MFWNHLCRFAFVLFCLFQCFAFWFLYIAFGIQIFVFLETLLWRNLFVKDFSLSFYFYCFLSSRGMALHLKTFIFDLQCLLGFFRYFYLSFFINFKIWVHLSFFQFLICYYHCCSLKIFYFQTFLCHLLFIFFFPEGDHFAQCIFILFLLFIIYNFHCSPIRYFHQYCNY